MRIEREGRRPWAFTEPFDVGIVPGATVYANGTASGALRRRVERAAQLWHEGAFPTLLISGCGRGGRTEASVGAELAEALGVPERHLIREERAMSTAENAQLSRALVHAERVLVITDTTHVRRCRKLFSLYFSDVDVHGIRLAHRSRLRMTLREAVIEAWRG